MDHGRRIAELERTLQRISSALDGLQGVGLEYVPGEGASTVWLRVAIDPAAARMNAEDLVARLREGSPAVYVGEEPGALLLDPATLVEGDEAILTGRIRALLG
jgi:hypothetical protein